MIIILITDPDLEYQHFSDSQVEINTGRYQSSDCLSIEMSLSINSLSNTFLQLDLMKVAREELSETMPVRVRDELDICFQQQALPMVLQRNTGEHLQFQEENQSRTLQDEKLQESHEEPDLEYRNPSQDLELKYYKVKVWRLLSRVMELLERKKLIVKQDLVEKFSDPGCSSKRNGKNYQPISPASFSKQKSSDCTARPITYTMNEVLPMQEPHSPKFSHVELTQSTLDSRCNRSRDKSSPSERNTAASQYKGSSPSRPQRLNYEDAENVKPKKSSPKGVSHQGQIKTELCKNWQENGDCPYSMHCRFAHGVEELRPVIRHPLYKTQICRMLLEGKVCIYGHRCHFRHALTDEEISMILHLNNGST